MTDGEPAASGGAASVRVAQFLRGLARAERPAFALLQVVIAQGLTVLVNAGTGVLTARLLGPDGRGAFAAISTWPQLTAQLAISGLGTGVLLGVQRERDPGAWLGAGLLSTWLTTTAAVALVGAAMPLLMGRYDGGLVLVAELCLLAAYQNATHSIFKQAFMGLGDTAWFNIANLVAQGAYLAALLACALTIGLTLGVALACLFGSGVLSLLLITPALLRRVRPRLRGVRAAAGRLGRFSVRAAGADLVGILTGYLDKIILVPLLAPADLGFYAVAFSLSRVVLLVQLPVASLVLTNLSRRGLAEARLLHDHAFRFGLVLLAGLVAASAALAHPLMTVFYGREFVRAVAVFRILIVEAALTCLGAIPAQLYLSQNRPMFVSGVQGVSALFAGALIPVLAQVDGATGAAWALLGAAGLRLCAYVIGLSPVLHIPPPRVWLVRADLAYAVSRFRSIAP